MILTRSRLILYEAPGLMSTHALEEDLPISKYKEYSSLLCRAFVSNQLRLI